MRSRFSALAGILFFSSCAVASVAQATAPQAVAKPVPDVILFKNGDQLSGTLVRGIGMSVVFKSEVAGEITVSLDKIKELRSTGSFAMLRKDVPVTRTSVATGTVLYADGNMTVANPVGAPELVPVKELAYLIDQATYDKELERKPGPFFGWNGNISGGATLVRATSNANTFTAGVALVRAIPSVPYLPARNRTSFNLQETYGRQTTPVLPPTNPATPDTVVKSSIFHTDFERDEYFTARFYALAQASLDHNFAQGLGLQQVYGVGIGWTPIKSAKQQLDVKADVHYELQQFDATGGAAPSPNQQLVGSTFAEAYRRVLPRKLVFTETANILPAWNNLSAYSANATAQLVAPIFKRLGLQVSTTDNFLNDPPQYFKKNSYQFVTGVTYSLH